MDWAGEIERMLSGYASAIEVICEVAAEGDGEEAAQLKPSIMEVFDLYRAPLQVMCDSLSPEQQQALRDLDEKLLAVDKEVHQLIEVSLSDHLKRIRGGASRLKRPRKSTA
jgi:hypothetical protein